MDDRSCKIWPPMEKFLRRLSKFIGTEFVKELPSGNHTTIPGTGLGSFFGQAQGFCGDFLGPWGGVPSREFLQPQCSARPCIANKPSRVEEVKEDLASVCNTGFWRPQEIKGETTWQSTVSYVADLWQSGQDIDVYLQASGE
eukprot:870047-Amphidinium_carterae.1